MVLVAYPFANVFGNHTAALTQPAFNSLPNYDKWSGGPFVLGPLVSITDGPGGTDQWGDRSSDDRLHCFGDTVTCKVTCIAQAPYPKH